MYSTESHGDRTTLVFWGVLALGLTQWPPPSSWGWWWGGCISYPPWVRDLGSLVPRWGTCPHHLPKRADPCFHFGFLRGNCPRGLAAASPGLQGQWIEWGTWATGPHQTQEEVYFFVTGKVETRGWAAQLPEVCKGGAPRVALRCDLAHLLGAVLLQGGDGYGLALFREGAPYPEAGSLWVWCRSD